MVMGVLLYRERQKKYFEGKIFLWKSIFLTAHNGKLQIVSLFLVLFIVWVS